MYKIITLAAAASLLTLAACNRETETAPAGDDATANADAMAAEAAATDASATSASATAPGASSNAGKRSSGMNNGSETMAPAESNMAGPTGAGVGPVTDETRANAQTAAEETNLHPKPPTN